MNLIKDTTWFIGIILALGVTWGMTSQRISAMEKDVDRMEEALITFTKMEVRLAVIEAEIKNINKKLNNNQEGNMNKLKDMWSNLSKKGKIFTSALIIILLVIIYSYIF